MKLQMEDSSFYLDKNTIVKIEWKYEEDGSFELENYGKPQRQVEEWVIDRRRGLLLGEWKEFIVSIPCEMLGMSFFNEDDFWVPDNDWQDIEPTSTRFAQAYKLLEPIVEAAHIDQDEWDVEYDSDENAIYVFLEGYQIVSDEPSNRRYERNSYEYFKPNMDTGTEGGKVNPKYLLQDYKRWEGYGDDWWLMYPEITIIREDEEGYEEDLGTGQCYAIDSDTDETQIREVLEMALYEALKEAGIELDDKVVLDAWLKGEYEDA